MGFFDKIMFWKKDDLKDFGDFGNNGFPSHDPLNRPFSEGFPDPGNYPGAGDMKARQEMNMTLEQNAMNPSGQPYFPQQPPYQAPPFRSFTPQEQFQESPVHPTGELQIISAKLDAIKATLDALNQRMINLENISYSEPRRRQW